MAEENRKGWAEREGGWRGGRGWVYQLLPSICACSLGATDVYLVPVIARCIASTWWLRGKELASRTGQPGVVARSNHSPVLPGPITPQHCPVQSLPVLPGPITPPALPGPITPPALPGPITPQCCPVQSLPSVARSNHSTSFSRSNHSTSFARSNRSTSFTQGSLGAIPPGA